jgi:quinol monooxygenase YgiN
MYTVIVIHHAAPEHTDAFIEFMHMVVDATSDAPGLLEFRTCREANGAFLAGYSRWETPEAFQTALPRIMSLAPQRKPEWSAKPDERIVLVDA